MNTSAKLRRAIKDCDNAKDEWIAARDRMRLAAREHFATLPKDLVKSLNISKEQATNLRKGYAFPSVEYAMKLSMMEADNS